MESGKPLSGELLSGGAAVSARPQRGLQIAALAKITERADGSWSVPSQSGQGRYTVRIGESCTCPDFEEQACKCKHMWAVEYVVERETTDHADGSKTVTESVAIVATSRRTYSQN